MIFVLKFIFILGCGLISLNLLGTDPADIIFIVMSGIIMIISPGAIFYNGIHPIARVSLFIVISLYILSCSFGWRSPSFIFYFVSGLAFALSIHWSTNRDDNLPIGAALFGGFLILNGFLIFAWSINYWPPNVFFDLFRDGRFMGPFGDPNMTGLMASFAFYFFLDRAIRPTTSQLAVHITRLGVIVALAILATSGSRSAWGAALVGLTMYGWIARRVFGFRTIISGIIFAVGLAAVSTQVGGNSNNVESFSDRFRTILVQDNSSEQERFKFVYTRAALDVAAEHPLGIGPGMTPIYTGISSVDGDPIGAHNSYVEIITENGWIMGGILFALLIYGGVRLYRLANRDIFFNDISSRVLIAGLTATATFGMGHDLLGWRVGWICPVLAIFACFSSKYDMCLNRQTTARSHEK